MRNGEGRWVNVCKYDAIPDKVILQAALRKACGIVCFFSRLDCIFPRTEKSGNCECKHDHCCSQGIHTFDCFLIRAISSLLIIIGSQSHLNALVFLGLRPRRRPRGIQTQNDFQQHEIPDLLKVFGNKVSITFIAAPTPTKNVTQSILPANKRDLTELALLFRDLQSSEPTDDVCHMELKVDH